MPSRSRLRTVTGLPVVVRDDIPRWRPAAGSAPVVALGELVADHVLALSDPLVIGGQQRVERTVSAGGGAGQRVRVAGPAGRAMSAGGLGGCKGFVILPGRFPDVMLAAGRSHGRSGCRSASTSRQPPSSSALASTPSPHFSARSGGPTVCKAAEAAVRGLVDELPAWAPEFVLVHAARNRPACSRGPVRGPCPSSPAARTASRHHLPWRRLCSGSAGPAAAGASAADASAPATRLQRWSPVWSGRNLRCKPWTDGRPPVLRSRRTRIA